MIKDMIKMKKKDSYGFSLIVPFYNESEGISVFCQKIDEYAKDLTFLIELVFVNDGSTDNSMEIIQCYKFKNVYSVKILNLSKNYGSHAAIRAGISVVRFNICTWIGADLQEPFDIINIAFEKIINEHCDIVYFSRKSSVVDKIGSFFSNVYSNLIKKIITDKYNKKGISTVAFNNKIIKYLNDNPELNSSVIIQIMRAGYKDCFFELKYNKRSVGKSKWTLKKKIKLFTDSFIIYSDFLIKFILWMSLFFLIFGLIIVLFTFLFGFVSKELINYKVLIVGILFFLFGFVELSIWIVGEYMWRTLENTFDRKPYIISDIINIK